jgi:hypothetical protein
LLPESIRKAFVALFLSAKSFKSAKTVQDIPTIVHLSSIELEQEITQLEYFYLLRLMLYGSNDEKARITYAWWNTSGLSFHDFVQTMVQSMAKAYVIKDKVVFDSSLQQQEHSKLLAKYMVGKLRRGKNSLAGFSSAPGQSPTLPLQSDNFNYAIEPNDFQVFSHFFYREPMFQKVLSIVYLYCFYPESYAGDQYNKLVVKNLLSPTFATNGIRSHFLTPSMVFFLNEFLPQDSRALWKLVYSSSKHGNSFSTFMHQITGQGPHSCKGKSLLLLRDSENHIFGAFANESWGRFCYFHCVVACSQPFCLCT